MPSAPVVRVGSVAIGALLLVAAWLGRAVLVSGDPPEELSDAPPPMDGYFSTLPAGVWSDLPDDEECAGRVHRSSWEPRPDNRAPNHSMPDSGAVRAAFDARPRATSGGYDARWDSWLLRRVTGHHTGTTDENIQWAACKWGISDNLLRAIAVRESGWFQHEVYPDGRCVLQAGCGDVLSTRNEASRVFCAGIARAGYDYESDFGPGLCPKTFSLVGVMSWHDPRWEAMPGNQNGTFPFNRDSTAFAMDYLGSFLRGCQEGWVLWLGNNGDTYRPGMLWDCVGVWYAGSWRSDLADDYVRRVRAEMRDRPWLRPDWGEKRLPCSPDHGCPMGVK